MKKFYYAVGKGKKPGIYREWVGAHGAEMQTRGFPGALFKKFASRTEAEKWLNDLEPATKQTFEKKREKKVAEIPARHPQGLLFPEAAGKIAPNPQAVVYADGCSLGNPGPGGIGVIVQEGGKRHEIAAGYARTTNNRMELMACIRGLAALPQPAPVRIYSDSQYVVFGIEKGWARKWQAKNWMRNKDEKAENIDLWERLLKLCNRQPVQFVWLRGHSGHPENERCDQLARQAAGGARLKKDSGYEK